MHTYKVYQIILDADKINECGDWSLASWRYPEVAAYVKVSVTGSRDWLPEYFRTYTLVAEITCNSLEDAFAALNGMGNGHASITAFSSMHSLSVGDILQKEDGTLMMVDPIGFSEISA